MSTEGEDVTPEVRQEAESMGWVDSTAFKGDPSKWVDAATFVRRGHEVMPILRKNNERLVGEVTQLKGQLTEIQTALRASQESIEALKTLNTEETRRKAEQVKVQTIRQIKEAREAGDVDAEFALTEQLSEQNDAIREADKVKEAPKKNAPAEPPVTPEMETAFKEWKGSTAPWFGTDVRRTQLAIAVANEYRQKPEFANLFGIEFLNRVSEEVDKVFAPAAGGTTRSSKVEPSRGGGGRSAGGRSFGDLPEDAKAACGRQVDRLVGPGRAFKNVAELQSHWAKKYYEGEE